MIICPRCGFENKNPKLEKRFRIYEGKGYSFGIEVETPSCEKCRKELYDKKIEETIRRIAHEKISNS